MRRVAFVFALALVFGVFTAPAQGQSNDINLTVNKNVSITASGSGSITINPDPGNLSGSTTINNAYTVDAVSPSTHSVTAELSGAAPTGVTSIDVDGPDAFSEDLTNGAVTVESGIADVLASSADLTYDVTISTAYPADGTSETITVSLTIQ